MTKLQKAIWETHQVELEKTDIVELEQNYCDPAIVDVVVTDTLTGYKMRFECFDTRNNCFPY